MWNPDSEAMPRQRLELLQLARLRETVVRILAAETPLAPRLRAAGIGSGAEIQTLADLGRLPFTVKTDLREHYPFGLFAVPRDKLLRLHASSGTRGKPTVVGYTRHDLDMWAAVMARGMTSAGVKPGMVVHNAYGYGLFTGGLGYHLGAETIGCLVVPISGGLTRRQVMLLQDFGAQVLCATPSYALTIAEEIERAGVDPTTLRLEVGLFGAEPWTEEMRTAIERGLGLRAMNSYGLSEMIGPGVAAECLEARHGLHIQEDHFLPEIVDPVTGQPLPAGETGELVLTTLTKEALPLTRYRTGDISSLDPSPCICGRTTVRMGRVTGRYDDMLIVRGVNLYPSEVERVLLATGAVGTHYQLVVERPETMDELTVHCEPSEDGVDRPNLQGRLERILRDETGVSIRVIILDRGEVPRSEGKAVRVVDRRRLS